MKLRSIIQKTTATIADHKYDNEDNINPAFSNIENTCLLAKNEKRIWVLRSDFNLVTGIKNVYWDAGNTTLQSKLAPHEQIVSADRYGHPSLAMPEKGVYDGSVYYAGWIAQRSDHLEIFLQSGRYYNDSLSKFERLCMELYIATQFIKCYGEYPVLFHDWHDDDEDDCSLRDFLEDIHLPLSSPRRIYTPDLIRQVTKLDQQNNITRKNLTRLFSQQNVFDLIINIDIHAALVQVERAVNCFDNIKVKKLPQYIALREKIFANISSGNCNYSDLINILREVGLLAYQDPNKRQTVAKVISFGLWKLERPAWSDYKKFIALLHGLPPALKTLLTTPESLHKKELFQMGEPNDHAKLEMK